MGISDRDLSFSDEEDEFPEDVRMDDDGSESESDSEPEDGDLKLSEPKKDALYDAEGLLDRLRDISWPENLPWIDSLVLDVGRDQEVDVNDDLARELSFYTQALEGTREAFGKIQKIGIPFLRPSDYYAEMVKSDSHMEKVRGRLLSEKRKMEEAEERKKAREAKKLAKEVQAQKQKDRAKQKKEEIEAVKKWRKQRQQSGFADKGDDLPLDFEGGKGKKRNAVRPGDRSGGKAWQGGKKGKFKKRESRDLKFGYGGKKGMKKQNTAETTNDFRGLNKASDNKKRKR